MAGIGGSIQSVTLDGRIFSVASDAESQRKMGGWENEVMANGNGTARVVKTRIPFSLDGITVEVDDSRGDHEFLQALQARADFFPAAITYASGLTYQVQAALVGELQVSSQSATAPISLSGPGQVVQQ